MAIESGAAAPQNRRLWSIRWSLFSSFLFVLVLMLGALAAIAYVQLPDYLRQAAAVLPGEVAQGQALLQKSLQPLVASVTAARDWRHSLGVTLPDFETLNQRFVPFLLETPLARRVHIVESNGAYYVISREDDEFRARLSGANPDEPVQTAKLSSRAEIIETLQESSVPEARQQTWFNSAKDMALLKSDGNLSIKPQIYFAPGATANPQELHAALAFRPTPSEFAAVCVDYDLDGLSAEIVPPSRLDRLYLVALANGDLLAQKINKPELSNFAGATAAEEALKIFSTSKQPPEGAFHFIANDHHWWAAFKPATIAGQDIYVGVATPQAALLAGLRPVLISVATAVGVMLAGFLILAWLLSRRISKPVRAISRRINGIDGGSLALGYWPKTRLRELQELMDGVDGLSLLVTTQAHNATSPAMAKRNDDASQMPATASNAGPPDVFLQALEATRKQLRHARQELEAAHVELMRTDEQNYQSQQRLRAQRQILMQLSRSRSRQGASGSDFEQLIRMIGEGLGHSISIWQMVDEGTLLKNVYTHTPGGVGVEKTVLKRSDLPVFFTSLEFDAVIQADDVRDEGRTRDLASTFVNDRATRSMLIAPVRAQKRVVGVIMFECHEPRHWALDEEIFILFVGQFLKRMGGGAAPSSAAAQAGAAVSMELSGEDN